MASPVAGLPDELAGHQVSQGASSLVLPNGPRYPRIVQAWRPASPRSARIRREAVTFVPHDGARCVVTGHRGTVRPAA